jgi:hypothetical protein
MKVAITNNTYNNISTPYGNIGPKATLVTDVSPEHFYSDTGNLKSLQVSGYITVVTSDTTSPTSSDFKRITIDGEAFADGSNVSLSDIKDQLVVSYAGMATVGSMASAHQYAATAKAGDKVYNFGDYNGDIQTFIYDGATTTWSEIDGPPVTTSDPASIDSASAVTLQDGRIFICGGEDYNVNPLSVSYLFSPATNTYATATAPAGAYINQVSKGAVVLASGDVLLSGSDTGACEIYNVASDSWTETGSLHNNPGNYLTAMYVPSTNKVVAAYYTNGAAFVEVYDVATGTWQDMTLADNVWTIDGGARCGFVTMPGTYVMFVAHTSDGAQAYKLDTDSTDPATAWTDLSMPTGLNFATLGVSQFTSSSIVVAGVDGYALYDTSAHSWSSATYGLTISSINTTVQMASGSVLIVTDNTSTYSIGSGTIPVATRLAVEGTTTYIYGRAAVDGAAVVIDNPSATMTTGVLLNVKTGGQSRLTVSGTGNLATTGDITSNGKVVSNNGVVVAGNASRVSAVYDNTPVPQFSVASIGSISTQLIGGKAVAFTNGKALGAYDQNNGTSTYLFDGVGSLGQVQFPDVDNVAQSDGAMTRMDSGTQAIMSGGQAWQFNGFGDGDAIGSSYIFNSAGTGSMTQIASLIVPRKRHAMAAIGSNRYVAIGGTTDYGNSTKTTSMEMYDVETDSWSGLADMPTARARLFAFWNDADSVVVFGGDSTDPSTVDVYSISQDSWSTNALGINGTVVYAGRFAGGPYGGLFFVLTNDSGSSTTRAIIHNGSTTWSIAQPPYLESVQAAIMENGNVITKSTAGTYIYDIGQNTWNLETSITLPSPFVMVGLANGNKVLSIAFNSGSRLVTQIASAYRKRFDLTTNSIQAKAIDNSNDIVKFVSTGGATLSAINNVGILTKSYTATQTGSAVTSSTISGRATIGAGTNSVQMQNTLVTATSRILVQLEGAAFDATLTRLVVQVQNGQFTVRGNANATANVVFWWEIMS